MTIGVKTEVFCDLCGALLDRQSTSYNAGAVLPEINAHQRNYELGGRRLQLCTDCGLPLELAFKQRAQLLREQGKLVGFKQHGPD